MTNLLPLDTFRAELGLHPWHFWGLADGQLVPINSKCSGLVFEYAWQGSDAAGRDDIRRALERADQALHAYVGYWPAPKYVESDALEWPRYADASLVRYADLDATGRRVAMLAPEFHVQAMGIERLTLQGTAGLIFSTRYGTPLKETWTAQIATTETDADKIAVYFTATDRLSSDMDRWRIEPVSVSIAGGIATITGATWLMVKPYLYENPSLQALDPTTLAATFVSSVEVYVRDTNGDGVTTDTSQATLIYETTDCVQCWGAGCCCAGNTGSTDPGTTGLVVARASIRNSVLGLVAPGAATFNAGTGQWSSVWCCGSTYCDPDRVTLRYLAGYPLAGNAMDPIWRSIVTMLGAAELKRRICACREVNERLHDLQMDMALQATETERYQRSPEDMNNPFGTRLGAIQAWKRASEYLLRRGFAA